MIRPPELDELIAEIDRERIERARETPLEEKFLAGFRLFKRAVALMTAGVRAENPSATEAEVDRIVDERLKFAHRDDEECLKRALP